MLSILLVSGNQNLVSLPIFFQKPDGSGDGSVEPPNNNRVFYFFVGPLRWASEGGG